MAKDIETLSLLDVLPPSIAGDANVQAIAKALTPELQSLAHDVRETLIMPRLDELPEPVLDLLAWERHVDFYELARTIEAKREVIRGSIQWHRKKGTVWAILKALEMFGVKGTFTPWWEIEGAKPYTFAIDAKLTDEYWERSDWEDPVATIRRAIVESKAKRSWMSNLYVHINGEATGKLRVGVAVGQSQYQKVGLPKPVPGKAGMSIKIGAAIAQGQYQGISLKSPAPGKAGMNIKVGVAIVQGQYQRIAPARPEPGNTGTKLWLGTAISSSAYTDIPAACA